MLFSFVLTSCSVEKKLQKYCPLCPTVTITKDSIYVKDSIVEVPYQIPADSSWYFALLECDSKGRVVVVENTGGSSGRAKKPKVSINNNLLSVTSVCDSLSGVVKALQREIVIAKNKVKEIIVPCPPCNKSHEMNFLEKTFFWLGILFLIYFCVKFTFVAVRNRMLPVSQIIQLVLKSIL